MAQEIGIKLTTLEPRVAIAGTRLAAAPTLSTKRIPGGKIAGCVSGLT
jgi:hypothetical protein